MLHLINYKNEKNEKEGNVIKIYKQPWTLVNPRGPYPQRMWFHKHILGHSVACYENKYNLLQS